MSRLDRFSTLQVVNFETIKNAWNVCIPDFQRIFCEERVQYFLDAIENYISEYSEVNCLGCIHFAKVNNIHYLVDGQHRYRAYENLLENFELTPSERQFMIPVIVRDCTDYEEVKQYFLLMNNHFITSSLPETVEKLSHTENVKKYIKERYPKFISNSEKPRFPNVNLDDFVQFLVQKFPCEESFFEKLNLFHSHLEEIIPNPMYTQIVNKGNLFSSYIYHSIKTTKRKALPSTVRQTLWTQTFGDCMTGTCYVCSTEISFCNFDAGHVVSVARGGSDSINNLRCVCRACNLSMGTMNIHDFKNKYYY